ncbi:MAG: glutamate-1-semialdehyde 2,1-aminomutase [Thermomicrobium sp.]|nr:glutamate-1-semialdehyde 2,1-aminomutase [Thermomicrobium sp.]
MAATGSLWEAALRYLPGGVDSPVRAFRAVGDEPVIVDRGEGAYLVAVDGTRYLDYICSWGALLAGHAHPAVTSRIVEVARRGTNFGLLSPLEVELARAIVEAVPSVEMIRFVNSGTEATMSALRLARAATGRSVVVKFAGCYHGHVDSLLVSAGSGVMTFGLPGTPGVTPGTASDTLVLPYNDVGAVEEAFRRHGSEIAAVIVEPVAGNMGVVPPVPSFLETLRRVTRAAGALLIFDEVITGFRLGLAGAQGKYGIEPDLTCFGKVIGGGLPVGAYGGRRDLMQQVAPSGPVYQAGTLAGNPLTMAAGLATIELARATGAYDYLECLGGRLESGLREAVRAAGIPAVVQRVGSMLTLFFSSEPVTDAGRAETCDVARFAAFHRAMRRRGILLPPSQFEAWFVSLAHTEDDVDRTVEAAADALREIARGA